MTPGTGNDLGKRDLPLEALRGLAALAVVGWHFLLAFYPAVLSDPGYGIAGTPFLAFVHGTGAVCVFFVLSGFVLTRHFFQTGQKRILVIGALKRWFRLFLPVFLSVMLSWALFHFHLYAYADAANSSGSDWLGSFGFAMIPPFEPTFLAALRNGFSEAFFHDNNAFNPLLWTIHIELMGSYVTFGFAAFVYNMRHNAKILFLALFLGILSLHFIEPFLIAFLPGVLLAFYAPRLRDLKTAEALGLITVGTVFLGYRDPVGFYAFLSFLRPINGEPLRVYTSTIGAVLVLISCIGFEPMRKLLQGSGARLLGRFSFPVYLIHLLLIFSLGSAVYVLARTGNSPFVALLILLAVLLPSILALAGIFVIIDTKWIAFVNKQFRHIKIAGRDAA